MRSRPLHAALLALLLAAGAAAPADGETSPVEIGDLERANRALADFQRAMAADRDRLAREAARLLHRKVVVPPPDEDPPRTETVREAWAAIAPPEARVFVGLVSEVAVGPKNGPQVSWRRRRGLTASNADPDAVFGAKWAPEVKSEASASLVLGAYTFGETLDREGSVEIAAGATWLGISRSGETFGLSSGGGFLFDPGAFVHLKIGVEQSLSLRMTEETACGIAHAVQVTGRAAWAVSKRAARAIAAAVQTATVCPYCTGGGEVPCPRCGNSRRVTCPDCRGAKSTLCARCDGSGVLACPPFERCSRCGGRGELRCPGCGGSGSVTSTEEYTEWRSVLVAAGFDENGDPYYRTEQQPYTTTRSVSATCNACGGSGRGGACDRCGGSGEVTCSECGGRGEVACSRCGGSGRVACGTCGGSGTIVCPYCRGAPLDCPLCGGTRTLLPKGAP